MALVVVQGPGQHPGRSLEGIDHMLRLPGTGCASGTEAQGSAPSASDAHSLTAAVESRAWSTAGPGLCPEPQLDTQPGLWVDPWAAQGGPQPSGSQSAS